MSYAVELADGIRTYGPGKYSLVIDEYFHRASCNGCLDEEAGDVSEIGGWFGLMLGPFDYLDLSNEEKEELTENERKLIVSCPAVIISENDQGSVWVVYYETVEEARGDWKDILKYVDSFYEDSLDTVQD